MRKTILGQTVARWIRMGLLGAAVASPAGWATTVSESGLTSPTLLPSGSLSQQDRKKLDTQREQYLAATAADDKGDIKTFETLSQALRDYPLYPYLAYRDFRRSLPSLSRAEVEAFIKEYPEMPFTQSARTAYFRQLVNQAEWAKLLKFQTQIPRGNWYQCQYYFAQSQAGDKKLALSGAKSLFLSGESVSSACDPLFNFLKDNGGLTGALYLDRMLLAYEHHNYRLMKYLNKQLDGGERKVGDLILDLYLNPDKVADFSKKSRVTPYNQRLTELTFQRLARKDAKKAIEQYQRTVEGQHYTAAKRQKMAEYVASRLMATDKPELGEWRDKVLAKTSSESLLERRIRQAMREGDWNGVEVWINRLPAGLRSSNRWQYWEARILANQGKRAEAAQIMESLLGERNYYSAAAATYLGKPIHYAVKDVALDTQGLDKFSGAFSRIGELIALNKESAAKSEWNTVLARAGAKQIPQLAAFARKQHWYHLTVQATIKGKMWDYLPLRLPVAHKWWYNFFSEKRDLPLTTLLALSRQESGFYASAISPAGARGLMQVMPSTAKATARKIDFNYKGRNTLTEPGTNIRIGSAYLREVMDRFGDNRILAFAAYNAGPHRVTKWLNGTDGQLDAFAFVEAIPFNETRGYVQNVLMYDMYYQGLFGKEQVFLTPNESTFKY